MPLLPWTARRVPRNLSGMAASAGGDGDAGDRDQDARLPETQAPNLRVELGPDPGQPGVQLGPQPDDLRPHLTPKLGELGAHLAAELGDLLTKLAAEIGHLRADLCDLRLHERLGDGLVEVACWEVGDHG